MPCSRRTRREFLQQSGCGLVSLAALGLPVSEAVGRGQDHERAYPIPPADAVNIDRAAQVILVRHANRIYAMALACPHENAAVKWVALDNRFQCTRHDSRYTSEGAYTSGRATRNLDRFPIRREGDSVVVTVDRVYRSDKDAAGWAGATVALS